MAAHGEMTGVGGSTDCISIFVVSPQYSPLLSFRPERTARSGEISERKRRTKGSRPRHTVRFLDCARNDRVWKVDRLHFDFCYFTAIIFSPFVISTGSYLLSFRPSVVFSLALAQNRGFCAKEERQRSEVASRVYTACLERSLPRRARGEISERQRRTRGRVNEFRCGNAAIRGRR